MSLSPSSPLSRCAYALSSQNATSRPAEDLALDCAERQIVPRLAVDSHKDTSLILRHGRNRILKIFDYNVHVALVLHFCASAIGNADGSRRGIGGQRLVRADFSGGKSGFDGCCKRCPNIYLVRVEECFEVGNGRRTLFRVSETDKAIQVWSWRRRQLPNLRW